MHIWSYITQDLFDWNEEMMHVIKMKQTDKLWLMLRVVISYSCLSQVLLKPSTLVVAVQWCWHQYPVSIMVVSSISRYWYCIPLLSCLILVVVLLHFWCDIASGSCWCFWSWNLTVVIELVVRCVLENMKCPQNPVGSGAAVWSPFLAHCFTVNQ